MEPGTAIDLTDKAAWDDTALIRAYDRAISAYQDAHGATPELLSVLRTKHCSRKSVSSSPSTGPKLAEPLDDQNDVVDDAVDDGSDGEDGIEEESEDDDAQYYADEVNRVTPEDIAAAEAAAAAEAEAGAISAANSEAAEEARRLEWARYYAWLEHEQLPPPPQLPLRQQLQPQSEPQQQLGPQAASLPAAMEPSAPQHASPYRHDTVSGCPPTHAGLGGTPGMSCGANVSGHKATSAATSARAAMPHDFETDLSNMMMAWYHAGFFTSQFQERHRQQ